jgi:hypothetical protein
MEPDLMFACADRIMFWVIMLDVKMLCSILQVLLPLGKF